MDISNNSSSEARLCWKKFYWRYDEKLTPIKQAPALTLGRIVHEAFDKFYNGSKVNDILLSVHSQFEDEIQNAAPEEQESLVIMRYIAIGMLSNYRYPDLADYEQIHSEREFSVKLMPSVNYCGRVDGLIKKNGKWWLREIKTTSQTQRIFNQKIETSSQATGYCWAMKQLGYDVQGVLFDFLRKPLLRKRVGDDQYQFGTRILDDYKRRPNFYFTQMYTYRSDKDLKLWQEDMKALAKDILSKKKSGQYYRNTGACYHYNFQCPYHKICFDDKPDGLMLQLYFRRDGKEIKS